MSTGHDGWYIAEPTGETTGPMTRAEMVAQFHAGRHSAEALCWHVDVAEWHPLRRIVGGAHAGVAEQARPIAHAQPRVDATAVAATYAGMERPQDRGPDDKQKRAQERAERKRMKREAMEKTAERFPDDGKRILQQTATGAEAAAASAKAAAARAPTGTAAAKPTGGTEHVPASLRRFAARAIDTAWLGIPGAALLWGAVNRLLADADSTVGYREPIFIVLIFLALFALVPLEAIAVGLFGRTPGKALLGLSVERRGGGAPGLLLGARRAREVLVRGLGLGIPIVTPITIIASGARLINQGSTSWDDRVGTTVRLEPIDNRRGQVALIVLVASWFAVSSAQFAALLNQLAALSWGWLSPG